MNQPATPTTPEDNTPADRSPEPSSQRGNWRPMLLSLVMHVVIFTLMILLVRNFGGSIAARGDEEGRTVEVVLTEINNKETSYLKESEVVPADESAESSASASASAASAAPPSLDFPELTPDAPGVQIDNPEIADANAMAIRQGQERTALQHVLTGEDLKLIEEDRRRIRASQPVGDPTSISVFGSGQLTGRKFVFVIDRSQSMGGVLTLAEQELSAAIDQLEPHHQFQIVGYNHRTTTISGRAMLTATDENKSKVPAFIRSLSAFGATNHEYGLLAALTFKPDVVVLITDGGLPELNRGQTASLGNISRSTSIHCVQFSSEKPPGDDHFMKRLAEKNNGSFRFISTGG